MKGRAAGQSDVYGAAGGAVAGADREMMMAFAAPRA